MPGSIACTASGLNAQKTALASFPLTLVTATSAPYSYHFLQPPLDCINWLAWRIWWGWGVRGASISELNDMFTDEQHHAHPFPFQHYFPAILKEVARRSSRNCTQSHKLRIHAARVGSSKLLSKTFQSPNSGAPPSGRWRIRTAICFLACGQLLNILGPYYPNSLRVSSYSSRVGRVRTSAISLT